MPRDGDDTMSAVVPFLRVPKTRKFMGKQDRMAVIAAGRALAGVDLPAEARIRTGFYLAVGFIPFERPEIETLAEHSAEAGAFSMARFSGEAIHRVNPLLTFRCLPNMPMFHVSANFGVMGGYLVTYPGAGQLYVALQEAACALEAGEIDRALVGGVADQDNFLVEFGLRRSPPCDGARPVDAAAFVLLEREADARARGVTPGLRLTALDVAYNPREEATHEETPNAGGHDYFGPASLPMALTEAFRERRSLRHRVTTRDGFDAASTWEAA
ncbi:hypothetical protein BWI17_14045 [Betaproteobacteria bacterium GR16-43]|nr:hypothetical protein BWI17_14045 [Betaproteobacteria bacterium GR16-43]